MQMSFVSRRELSVCAISGFVTGFLSGLVGLGGSDVASLVCGLEKLAWQSSKIFCESRVVPSSSMSGLVRAAAYQTNRSKGANVLLSQALHLLISRKAYANRLQDHRRLR
jgi:hypothetical protein